MTTDNYLIISLKAFLCLKYWEKQLVSSLPPFPLLFPIHKKNINKKSNSMKKLGRE